MRDAFFVNFFEGFIVMLQKLKTTLWGDLSNDEFKRFGRLSIILLFIIGTYWLMRPLKDGIFAGIVGASYLPYAKMASFACILPIVLGYAKLVDMFAKQRLFYILCGLYSLLFIVISVLLKDPEIGLANTVTSPNRILGWVVYIAIESFGSLLVSLFWSFVASNTEASSAKRGYALIILGAQLGSMGGPLIATRAKIFGLPMLTLFVGFALLFVPLLVKLFIIKYPSAAEGNIKTKKKTSPWEGLRLIATRKYLLGILAISTIYEVVATYLDMNFKMLGKQVYASNEAFTAYLGWFGFSTNLMTFVMALVGTSFFIRRFGLTFCLVAYPCCASVLLLICTSFSTVLPVFFVSVLLMKAMSYALNNPCKEIMYIPTSKDVKFKAKGAIDMFGGRSAKASGASVAALASYSFILGPVVSFAFIGLWVFSALFVGRRNKELTDTGETIS